MKSERKSKRNRSSETVDSGTLKGAAVQQIMSSNCLIMEKSICVVEEVMGNVALS